METTAKENLIPLKPLQIETINTGTLALSGIINPADVLSPLVSAEVEVVGNTQQLNIKIVVFIPPTLLGPQPLELYRDGNIEDHQLKLVLQYISTDFNPPSYHPWYVCYVHPIAPGEEQITSINTALENIVKTDENPRTRRGTVTHVLES